MKAAKTWLNFLTAAILTACATNQFYQTAALNDQMKQTLAKANTVATQSEHDYAEKSYLFKNVDPTISGETQTQFRDYFNLMTASLENARKAKKEMDTAKSAFDEAVAGKNEINSKDKEWGPTEDSAHRFDDATHAFNKAILDYSSQSNTLTGMITNKRLYFTSSVKDVKSRLESTIKKDKKNLNVLIANIKTAEKTATKNGRPMDDTEKQTLKAEETAFSDHLKELEDINISIEKNWAGRRKISSVDPEWNQFQKLMTDAEIHSKEMQDITDRMPAEIHAMELKSSH